MPSRGIPPGGIATCRRIRCGWVRCCWTWPALGGAGQRRAPKPDDRAAHRGPQTGDLWVRGGHPAEPDTEQGENPMTITTGTDPIPVAPYPGPTYVDGRISVGPRIRSDAEWAEYVAWDEGRCRCRNGLVVGAPGSGKTTFLEAVTLGLRASGDWYVLVAEGDPWGASPLLRSLAHRYAAGPREVLTQLEALEALIARQSALGIWTVDFPPGVQWVIDDLYRLTRDEWLVAQSFAERLARVARYGYRHGIAILAATATTLIEDCGMSAVLRASLAAGNFYGFRDTSAIVEGSVINGVAVAPRELPRGGGYAHTITDGQLSTLRVAWDRDMAAHAADLPDVQLGEDAAEAMAAAWPDKPANTTGPVRLARLRRAVAARLRALSQRIEGEAAS